MFRALVLIALIIVLGIILIGGDLRLAGTADCIAPAVCPPPEAIPLRQVHDWLAGGLGFLLLVLTGLAFRLGPARRAASWLVATTLVLVVLAAWLGMHLAPASALPLLAVAHSGLSWLALLALWRAWLEAGPIHPLAAPVPVIRGLSALAVPLLLLQMLLGIWQDTLGAADTCADFPLCRGSWWPEADFAEVLGALGAGGSGPLSEPGRIALVMAYRLVAVGVALSSLILAAVVVFTPAARPLRKLAALLLALVMLELVLGAVAVWLQLPRRPLTIAETGTASLLVLTLVTVHFRAGVRVPAAPTVAEPAPAMEWQPPITLPPAAVAEVPVEVPTAEGLLQRLQNQLGKTRSGLTGFLAGLTLDRKAIDRELLDDIEAQLLMADLGVTATREIIDHLTENLDRHQLDDLSALSERLKTHLYEILEPVSRPLVIPEETRPFVLLVVGVNGVGKTTTIGKLARRLQQQGKTVMLAAGDTFRAAAVEQLQTWGERNGVPVIAQHSGADSASVIYDALQAAQARGVDVLIADTAGRLHTKSNLMEELSKIKRIMARLDPTAPHEVLLVLDAGTGQNALNQARLFNEAVGLTGLALTKLDGTAKGGVIFALAKQFGIPVRYIGIGERVEDLQDFDARRFIDALFAA